MANGDPRTMTPGSEVADVLQSILARRRADSRQAMIDQLAREEQASVHAQREEQMQLARQAEKRLADASAAQVAAANENLFQTRKADVRRGTRPEEVTDEAFRKQLLDRGLFDELLVQGPSIEGGTLPPISTFRGTPEEEEKERQRGMFQELAARYPEMGGGLEVLGAGGPAIPSMLQRRVPARILKPETMKVTELPDVMVPENDALSILPYTPRMPATPAAALPKPWRVIDNATGNDIGSIPLAPGDMAQWQAENPGMSLRPANFQAKDDPTIPGTLRNKVTSAREGLVRNRERDTADQNPFAKFFGYPVSASPDTLGAEAEYSSAFGQMLAADTSIPENVKQIAISIMQDPANFDVPTGELVESEFSDIDGNPIVLSPSEKDALSRVLMSRGVDISTAN